VNDRRPMMDKEEVYEIPCSCGKTYLGQTRRGLKVRIKEHIRDVKEDKYVTSAIQITVQFEKANLLHNITDYSNRLHKEAIEIFKSMSILKTNGNP
jgi:hypothetical protein